MAANEDIWTASKSILADLYEVRKKTLKELKDTMERQHGFPPTPLPTYETKIRELGLRKNLKKSEWSMIYNYTNARGLHKFELYFHGNLVPWIKISKEFRRYAFKAVSQPAERQFALPNGIEVRAPRALDGTSASHAPISRGSGTPEIDMIDAGDSSTEITPQSNPAIPPTPQSDGLLADIGWPSPVNDMNRWGIPSRRGSITPVGISKQINVDTFAMPELASSTHDCTTMRQASIDDSNQWGIASHMGCTSPTDSLGQFLNFDEGLGPRSPTHNSTIVRHESVNNVTEITPIVAPQNSIVRGAITSSASTIQDQWLYARYHLENLPWNHYRLGLLAMRGDAYQLTATTRVVNNWSLAVMPADGFFEHSHRGQPVLVSETCFPSTSGIYKSMSPGDLSTQFDPYYVLAQVVYLFSNNLHGDDSYDDRSNDEHVIELLHSLAGRIPKNIVFNIFKSNELSIRAVWESLFRIASKLKVKDGLNLLITIGLQLQPAWVDDSKEDVLFAATSIGDTPLVKTLLDRWSCLDPNCYVKPTCFGAAAACGAIDCAKLLLEKCDPNGKNVTALHAFGNESVSIFVLFVYEYRRTLGKPNRDFAKLPAYAEILDLFIAAGADIDTPFPSEIFGALNFGWGMSCLDILCYLEGSMFSRIISSSRDNPEVTRAGICNALLQGHFMLTEYLASKRAPFSLTISQCLRVVLIEQFWTDSGSLFYNVFTDGQYAEISELREELEVSLNANRLALVRSLIGYGITLRAWRDWEPDKCLKMVLQTAMSDGLSSELIYLLNESLEAGAEIGRDAYCDCIAQTGTEVLTTLITRDPDFKANGKFALFKAAKEGNYDMVFLLLAQGVDINSELLSGGTWDRKSKQATLLSHLLLTEDYKVDEMTQKQQMWEFFIKRGAKLRLEREHATCYQLLCAIINAVPSRRLTEPPPRRQWQAFEFVLESDKDTCSLPTAKWENLLRLAVKSPRINFSIIKALFQRCSTVSEPLLSHAIMGGCSIELMQKLIDAGQSVNEYSGGHSPLQIAASRSDVSMVTRLLDLGAEINSPTEHEVRNPAFQRALRTQYAHSNREYEWESFGLAALQFACKYKPPNLRMMEEQKRLIKLLVHHGADINAPAHGEYTSTALQLLCEKHYDLPTMASRICNLIKFFIERGADVNIAPGFRTYSALQNCAWRGHLEEAVILVQYGVDPNAHPGVELRYLKDHYGRSVVGSALDIAAGNGRLDMTQYLLNINALSAVPGTTGYQGALDVAVKNSYHAVAEIIRSHVVKLHQEFARDAQLHSRHIELIEQHAVALERRRAEYSQFLDPSVILHAKGVGRS